MRFKFLTFLVLFTIFVYSGIRLYYYLTHGFTIENITSNFPFDDRWVTVPLVEEEEREVKAILSQEFYYLGKGCQSYVFESKDGAYVLKFFKYQRYKPKEWLNHFTFIPAVQKLRLAKIAKKTRKREKVFSSWTAAFNYAKRETGLVYVHLNKSTHLQKNLAIFDKLGIKHVLDIDQFEFLIQKKATMLEEYIERQMDARKEREVLSFLNSLVHMIKEEYERGISDHDPALMQNTGVISGKPIHIDVGQFDIDKRYQDPALYQEEIYHKFFKFRRWLSNKYPSLAIELDQHLQREFGEGFFHITPNPRYL